VVPQPVLMDKELSRNSVFLIVTSCSSDIVPLFRREIRPHCRGEQVHKSRKEPAEASRKVR
jgi:hypothetical protein